MTTITIEVPSTLTYRAPKNGPVYTLDMAAWDQATQNTLAYALMLHGFSQKIGDSAAGDENDMDRHESRTRVLGNLQSGKWAEKGGARLDPVLVEMRGIAVAMKLMKADAARKATEAEIEAATGAKFKALKVRAEAIVALANAPLDVDEPEIEVPATEVPAAA